MDYWPEGWKYIDLNKIPIDQHEQTIDMTLEFFSKHERIIKIIEYRRQWEAFKKTNESKNFESDNSDLEV